jgi:hypothetical protein
MKAQRLATALLNSESVIRKTFAVELLIPVLTHSNHRAKSVGRLLASATLLSFVPAVLEHALRMCLNLRKLLLR